MTDKVQKIREGVVWLLNNHDSALDYEAAIEDVLSIIDSLQDEHVSEDLEEAVNAYIGYAPEVDESSSTYGKRQAFKAGAQWQKQKDSMPVSNDFEEVVKKLWDEINSGHEYSVIESYNVFFGLCLDIANWEKEQMMSKAIDGVVTFDYYDSGDKTYGCIAHNSFCLEDFGLKDKDEVKVILIKAG